MTVYMDQLKPQGMKLYGKHVESCHLMADSVQELQEFARRIFLKDNWLQARHGQTPHYDITRSKRLLALEAGAVDATDNDFLRLVHHYRIQDGLAPEGSQHHLIEEGKTTGKLV